jgi:sporulation integral membrane protein YtvI
VTSSIEQSITTLTNSVQNLVTATAEGILHYIATIPSIILLVLVSAIATYFLSRDREKIARSFLNLIPSPWDEKLVYLVREITGGFVGFTKAQLVLMSITITISVSGLFIIGAEYALTIGLLAGFLDLLPIVGPAMVYLPWIIWSFVSGDTTFAFKLLILYAILASVRQILEAKIVSVNLGLHPLATLVAMYTGLKLIGVIGLLVGPILLIALKAVLKAGVININKA